MPLQTLQTLMGQTADFQSANLSAQQQYQKNVQAVVGKQNPGVSTAPTQPVNAPTSQTKEAPTETPLGKSINVRGETYIKIKAGPDSDQSNWKRSTGAAGSW